VAAGTPCALSRRAESAAPTNCLRSSISSLSLTAMRIMISRVQSNDMGRDDWWVVGGASVFLLLGVFLLSIGLRNVWRALASEGWPKAPAVVASSEESTSTAYNTRSRSTSTMYTADIRFRYRVDGREYVSAVRHFGQTEGSGDYSEAELLRFRYSPGNAATVSYNPANPSIAAAEPGFDLDAIWLPGAGLAFLVPAIMFIVVWFGMSRGNGGILGIGMAIFSSIFCAIGILMLSGGLPNLWRAWQSPHWPHTKGVIVFGQLDKELHNEALVDETRQFAVSPRDRVIFRYRVDGHTYFSNVRRFGQVPESNGFDGDVPRLYPLGREVPVVYAPRNPGISALETGIAEGGYWLPGAGAAFLLFGLAVFFVGIPALTR